jgi:hypothetical protein
MADRGSFDEFYAGAVSRLVGQPDRSLPDAVRARQQLLTAASASAP